MLRQCTKFDFHWDFPRPARGAYSAPQRLRPPAGFKGATSEERKRRGEKSKKMERDWSDHCQTVSYWPVWNVLCDM